MIKVKYIENKVRDIVRDFSEETCDFFRPIAVIIFENLSKDCAIDSSSCTVSEIVRKDVYVHVEKEKEREKGKRKRLDS